MLSTQPNMTYPHRKDWAAHFPTQKFEQYSAYPLLVQPTHFVGDVGWFSDTEPATPIEARFGEDMEPPEQVLREAHIRKMQLEKEEESRQNKIKEQATKRQLAAMKEKLKPRVEL